MNIFARELQHVLKHRGQSLNRLYSIAPFINKHQVQRLILSQTQDISAVLSQDNLENLLTLIGASEEEVRRLRAAILGEAVRRLLLDRLASAEALEVGQLVFQLLFDAHASQLTPWRRRIQELTRPAEEDSRQGEVLCPESSEQQIAQALEPAISYYEQGISWLDIAVTMPTDILKKAYAALAASLLSSAYELVAYPAEIADGSVLQQELLPAIVELQATAAQLAECHCHPLATEHD